jgi:hypothetical protein
VVAAAELSQNAGDGLLEADNQLMLRLHPPRTGGAANRQPDLAEALCVRLKGSYRDMLEGGADQRNLLAVLARLDVRIRATASLPWRLVKLCGRSRCTCIVSACLCFLDLYGSTRLGRLR